MNGVVDLTNVVELDGFNLNYINDDYAIVIPAGTWHNVYNTGNKLLKLYSIYAPPHHPKGTVHITKNDQI